MNLGMASSEFLLLTETLFIWCTNRQRIDWSRLWWWTIRRNFQLISYNIYHSNASEIIRWIIKFEELLHKHLYENISYLFIVSVWDYKSILCFTYPLLATKCFMVSSISCQIDDVGAYKGMIRLWLRQSRKSNEWLTTLMSSRTDNKKIEKNNRDNSKWTCRSLYCTSLIWLNRK